jgi:hypothetical protein
MRILHFLVFAFLSFGLARPAHAYDPDFAKIISYSQLMKLSPPARAEYVRQVRFMVSEFEEMQKNFAGDPNAFANVDSPERNQLLNLMMDEAAAATVINTDARAFLQSQTPSYLIVKPKPQPFKWPSFEAAYPCSAKAIDSVGNLRHQIVDNGARAICVGLLYTSCPKGYEQIGRPSESNRVCWARGRTDAQTKALHTEQAVRSAQANRQAQAKLAKAPKPAKLTRAVSSIPRSAAASGGSRSRNAESETATPATGRRRTRAAAIAAGESTTANAPESETPPVAGDADSDDDGDETGTTTRVHTDSTTAVLPPFQVSTDIVGHIRENNPFLAADDSTCADTIHAEDTPNCTDESIAEARKKYFRNSDPHCLFGGNLRHYANRDKRPGHCQQPHEFCLSSVHCRKEDGSRVTSENPSIKCSDSKKILCNPLIFNLDENNEGLCVPPVKNATRACQERATDVEKAMGKNYVPFISRGLIRNGSESMDGLKEAWDSYANELNKICDDSPSKDLYCRECAILKKRAAMLNLLALRAGKKSANGNCYEFSPIIKTTEPSPAGAAQ